MPIGEILLRRACVTEEQLEDALQNQKFFPAKTGTQLVELGFIPLEIIERTLSEQFGYPGASDEDLSVLDAFCRNQFPVEALERFQVLPFLRRQGVLYVAMVNPADQLAQNWLRDSSESTLEVFCISEIRFFYFLFRHFRRDAKPKIRSLAFRYFKQKCQQSLSGKENSSSGMRSELAQLGLAPLGPEETLGDPNLAPWELQGVLAPPSPKPVEFEPEFADFSRLK